MKIVTSKRLGLFIDLNIIQNPELDWENKVLLSEIIALSKLQKGCIASNQMLADFIQLKRQSIHRRIKFLVEKEYITTENIFSGGKCIGRIITPTGKVMSATASSMTAHADTLTAQADTNDSTRYHSMTAGSDPINSLINSGNSGNSGLIQELPTEEQLNKYLEKFNII